MRWITIKEGEAASCQINLVVQNDVVREALGRQASQLLKCNDFCSCQTYKIPHPSKIFKIFAPEVPRSYV